MSTFVLPSMKSEILDSTETNLGLFSCICVHCKILQFLCLNTLSFLIFDKAQEKKASLKKVPKQIIISEVRQMVEEMQSLNNKLEETEAAIEEYFKPIDKEAEIVMKERRS